MKKVFSSLLCLKMNSIEEKYFITYSSSLIFSTWGLKGAIRNPEPQTSEKVFSFIRKRLSDDCWVSASVTPSKEIFVLHTCFVDPDGFYETIEQSKETRRNLQEDIPKLLNLGRQIILLCPSEEGCKYYSLQKKKAVEELNDESTFEDLLFESLIENW